MFDYVRVHDNYMRGWELGGKRIVLGIDWKSFEIRSEGERDIIRVNLMRNLSSNEFSEIIGFDKI